MTSRAEITTKFAKAYARAGKKGKGRILDQVVEVTGLDFDNGSEFLNKPVIKWAGERESS